MHWGENLLVDKPPHRVKVGFIEGVLFTYIHLSLANFSQLFKQKSLSFVNLSFFFSMTCQYFGWNIFIFCSKLPRTDLKVHVLWCKTGIYSWILSEKVSLMYETWFPIPLLYNLKYISLYFLHNSMNSSRKWLIPFRACHVFLIDPRCFGPFGKFQDTREISM